MLSKKEPITLPNNNPTFNPVCFDELNWHDESEIPEGVEIFDLEALCQGKDLYKLKNALESNYPFYLKNFGISEAEVENIYNRTREFFKQSEEQKTRMVHEKLPLILRGYTPYGAGAYENNIVNARSVNQYCKYAWGPSDNVYPNEEFKEAFTNYYRKIDDVSERILDCIGEAMDLKGDAQWSNIFGGEETVLHCQVYYPEKPIGNQRMIPHADASTVTILNQLPSPSRHVGLSVKIGEEFVGVPPIRGTIVIMAGEALNSFTNSRIKPVVHAVVGPKDNYEFSERSSMPFFANPQPALKMKCPKETMHKQFYVDYDGMCFADFAKNIHRSYKQIESLRLQKL